MGLFCSRCGQSAPPDAAFCAACGGALARPAGATPIVPVPQPAALQRPPSSSEGAQNVPVLQRPIPIQRRSSTAVGWSLVTLALIFGLVGAFFYLSRQRSDSPDASEWPPVVRSNFVNACVSTGGTSSECNCFYGKIQDGVTYDEYLTAESNYLSGASLPPEILKLAIPCAVVRPPPITVSAAQVAAAQDQFARGVFAEFQYQATTWRRFNDVLGDTICFAIEFTNVGSVDGSPRTYEFSLVGPTGQVKLAAYPVDVVPFWAEVVPGAGGSGEVCFLGGDENGPFKLRWRDAIYSGALDWSIDIG